MHFLRLRSLVVGVVTATLLTTASTAAAAQGGTVQGTVTEQGTGSPLQDARVMIVGSAITTTSGPDGKFVLRGVPAGAIDVRVLRVGFQEQKKSTRVTANQTATLDFAMAKSIVQLQEVVTTATGEQRKVEVGNAVEQVSVADITATAPVRNFADVLNARVPGVMVQSGTQTGSGQRIRVRGISSLSLSNDPIFIIDGTRMSSNNGSTSFGNGGNDFSRLGDISPEEIENIEIVKGPSAATLYGTDAANGVVVITTKKGRTGRSSWNVYAEGGVLDDRNWYSDNYTLAGMNPTTKAKLVLAGQCTLVMVSLGTCVKSDGTKGYDSLRVYNPIKDPSVTPLGYGNRDAEGVQLTGGSDVVRYFMSAGRDNEIGVFKLDQYEQHRWDSLGVNIHPWQERPNTRLLNSIRGNISAQVNPQFDASMNVAYSTVNSLTSNESNNTVGIGSQAFGGPGYRNNGLVSGLTDSLLGYRAGTPGLVWAEKLQQNVNRAIVASNLNYRPYSWMQTRANFGVDFTDRVDDRLHMNGEGWPLTSTYRDGEARNGRTNITNLSADIGATANYNPSHFNWLGFKTTVGTQYNNYRLDQNTAVGTTLPPGAVTVSAGATNSGTGESYTLQKTWGVFVQEDAALHDRLYLTAAVRSDQNSAFGTKFQRVYYPKASLSWVITDEDFFPHSSIFRAISDMRIRLATGASGVQPGPTDALRTFTASSASIKNTDVPIETFQAIGNDSLKPERSVEWEGGFDSKLFGNRIQFDVTYYSKLTHDAIIGAVIAPSLGSGATRQNQNLGSVKNAGIEFTVGGQVIDRKQFGFDFHLTSSLNANKVVSLGSTPPQIGVTNWTVAGYPIGGIWAKAITGWNDKNGDGILTVDEVNIVSDTMFDNSIDPATGKPRHTVIGVGTFRGYAEPRYLTTFNPAIDLLSHKLRITSLFDWRGGNKYYNQTERIRCTRPNCNGLFNPAASFQEQAMVVAAIYAPEKTLDGYMQPGAYVKLREVTATLELPARMFAKVGARNASLVFAARNLHTWTNYRGSDPESDFTATGGGDTPSEFQTFAAPTLFQFRLNLGF